MALTRPGLLETTDTRGLLLAVPLSRCVCVIVQHGAPMEVVGGIIRRRVPQGAPLRARKRGVVHKGVDIHSLARTNPGLTLRRSRGGIDVHPGLVGRRIPDRQLRQNVSRYHSSPTSFPGSG